MRNPIKPIILIMEYKRYGRKLIIWNTKAVINIAVIPETIDTQETITITKSNNLVPLSLRLFAIFLHLLSHSVLLFFLQIDAIPSYISAFFFDFAK